MRWDAATAISLERLCCSLSSLAATARERAFGWIRQETNEFECHPHFFFPLPPFRAVFCQPVPVLLRHAFRPSHHSPAAARLHLSTCAGSAVQSSCRRAVAQASSSPTMRMARCRYLAAAARRAATTSKSSAASSDARESPPGRGADGAFSISTVGGSGAGE